MEPCARKKSVLAKERTAVFFEVASSQANFGKVRQIKLTQMAFKRPVNVYLLSYLLKAGRRAGA